MYQRVKNRYLLRSTLDVKDLLPPKHTVFYSIVPHLSLIEIPLELVAFSQMSMFTVCFIATKEQNMVDSLRTADIFFPNYFFLVADTQLYERLFPSVRPW